MESESLKKYNISLNMLKLYLKSTNIIPNEREWNWFAKEEGYLSSKSFEYFFECGFNEKV